MNTETVTTETLKEWLDNEYSTEYMTVYRYSDYVRVTNGSPGYFIDVKLTDENTVSLQGKIQNMPVNESCDATRTSVITKLATLI